MSADKRFSHESLQDAKTIKTLLTALSKGFARGEMTLSDDNHALVLQTGKLMTLRIKGERAEGRCSVNLRISWTDPEAPDKGTKGRPKIQNGSQ